MQSIKRLCPACGHDFKDDPMQHFNATINPEIRHLLMQGRLFQFFCPVCGRLLSGMIPLVYVDTDRKFALYFTDNRRKATALAEVEAADAPEYTRRIVYERNGLLEKIFVFESGLDDRAIAMLDADITAYWKRALCSRASIWKLWLDHDTKAALLKEGSVQVQAAYFIKRDADGLYFTLVNDKQLAIPVHVPMADYVLALAELAESECFEDKNRSLVVDADWVDGLRLGTCGHSHIS